MHLYKLLSIGFLTLITTCSFSQKRVTIFYDSTWSINNRTQASYYRNTFFDTLNMQFAGLVQDHYADGAIAMKGKYQRGLKQGTFTFYYPNGAAKANGKFVDGIPVGKWAFYYPDSRPWQTLFFIDGDFQVENFYDKSGNQKVVDGNGHYEGHIYSPAIQDKLFVDGLIDSFRKDGIWVYYNRNGQVVYEEKYINGKFKFTKKFGLSKLIVGKYAKPVGNHLILPAELSHTERLVYAADVRKSNYLYMDFLPDEDTVYYDSHWQITDSTLAQYYWPTNINNVEQPTGQVRYYYLNGQLQMDGRFLKGIKEGLFTYYHKNGKVSSSGFFSKGTKSGLWKEYYPDGNDRQWVFYEDKQEMVDYYWSLEGDLLVEAGTGNYMTYQTLHGISFREEGKMDNYQKVGIWKGFRNSGEPYFIEEYVKGSLIGGKSFDHLGNQYQYVDIEQPPIPKKGMKHFYSFISDKLIYPTEARKLGVAGKVFVKLQVGSSGEVNDIQVIKSPHIILSKQVLQTIRRYDTWNPGRLRGQLSDMNLTLPITFEVSEPAFF